MVQVYLGIKGNESESELAPAQTDAADASGQGRGGEPVDGDALHRFITNFQAAGGSVA